MLRDIDTIKIYKNNVSYLSNRLLSRIACEIEDFYDKKNYIDVTDFTVFLQDKTDLINEVLKIDSLMLPNKVSNDQIYDYVKTIDNGVLKNEINHIDGDSTGQWNYIIHKRANLLINLSLRRLFFGCCTWKRIINTDNPLLRNMIKFFATAAVFLVEQQTNF